MTPPVASAPWRPRRRPFHRVATWTVSGTLLYTGGQAAILIALAKLGSAEVVGNFALAGAVAGPITLLGRLGMRPLVATETSADLTFADYLSVQLLTIPVCLLLVVLVAAVGPFSAEVAWTIITLGCATLIESTGTVFYGLMDRHERQRRIAISLGLKGLGGVVAVAWVYWVSDSIALAGAALAGCWLLVMLAVDLPLARKLCKSELGRAQLCRRPEPRVVRRILSLCLSVGVTAALRELNMNLPYYFLKLLAGPTAVGYFAAVALVSKLGRVLFRGVSQAASPRLAHYYQDAYPRFTRLVIRLLLLAAAIGATATMLSATVGGFVLAIVYQPEYADHQSALTLLAAEIAFGLGVVVLRQSLIASRRLVMQIPQVLLTSIVLAVFCMLFIPHFGLLGAAWAYLLGSVFDCLANAALFRTLQKRSRTSAPQAEAVK